MRRKGPFFYNNQKTEQQMNKNIPHAEQRYMFHGVPKAAESLGVSTTALNSFLRGTLTSRPLFDKVLRHFPNLLTPDIIKRYANKPEG